MKEEKALSEARLFALKKLSRKSCLSCELDKALAEKKIPPSLRKEAIEEMERLGYLDDALYLDAFVRFRAEKNYGPRYIVQKLILKGVSRSDAEKAVFGLVTDEIQEAAIEKLLEKRPCRKEDYAKNASFLARRGFDLGIIHRILTNMSCIEI